MSFWYLDRIQTGIWLLFVCTTESLLLGQSIGPSDPVHQSSYEQLVNRGYRPLFNRRDLSGWKNPFSFGRAIVADNEIQLTGDRKFFLVTEQTFADFVAVVDVHLPAGAANSGIMFRCHVEPDRVFGYQAEVDGSDRRWSGGLYDEGRRDWIWPSTRGRSQPQFLEHEQESKAHFSKPEIRDAFRRDDWNRYVIECVGDHLRIFVNGVLITDFHDRQDAAGFLGLQHHGEKDQVYRFRNLLIRELAASPAEFTVKLFEQTPVAIKQLEADLWLVDFGKVAFGNLSWLPSGGQPEKITFHFGENLINGRVDRQPPGTVRYQAIEVDLSQPGILGDGRVSIAPIADRRNTEQVHPDHPPAVLTPAKWGVVLPFRWVEIQGWKGPVTGQTIVRNAASSKSWNDDASHFESSDNTLNQVWDLCKYSIKATTFAGVYVDGDRERIPYEGDAYLNQLSHYATDTDIQMARATFDWLMQHGTWPSEWGPHMVFMAHADWMQTGDREWLSARYETLKTKTLADRVGDDSLVRSNQKQRSWNDLVDWPVGERDEFVYTEINTVINAFRLSALKRMSKLADALGKEDEAKQWNSQYVQSLKNFQTLMFDTEAGIYRDGVGTKHSSLHANLFPLAFGLVPDEHQQSVRRFLVERGMRCSVYAAQYLLEGLFQSGADQEALAFMLADNDRSWKHMLNSGTTITWEAWDQKYKPNQDWNHAWGAAPANLLPRFVFGVQPNSAGWSQTLIRPHPSGLKFAKGRVPTPKGSIEIHWTSHLNPVPQEVDAAEGDPLGKDSQETNSGNDSSGVDSADDARKPNPHVYFQLELSLPRGVTAKLELPAHAESQTVLVDGEPVKAIRQQDRWFVTEQVFGKVAIQVR